MLVNTIVNNHTVNKNKLTILKSLIEFITVAVAGIEVGLQLVVLVCNCWNGLAQILIRQAAFTIPPTKNNLCHYTA